jgi:hypothetical protein
MKSGSQNDVSSSRTEEDGIVLPERVFDCLHVAPINAVHISLSSQPKQRHEAPARVPIIRRRVYGVERTYCYLKKRRHMIELHTNNRFDIREIRMGAANLKNTSG